MSCSRFAGQSAARACYSHAHRTAHAPSQGYDMADKGGGCSYAREEAWGSRAGFLFTKNVFHYL